MPGRVVSRRQFAEFAAPTGRGRSGPLRVVFVEHSDHESRDVAYAIGRKVGIAVIRNRIRRRLRAAMDGLSPAPRNGLYLIKCGNGTGQLSYDELQHHLLVALQAARAL